MSRRLDPDFLALVTEHEETLLRAARLLTGDWDRAAHLLRDTLVWALGGWEGLADDEVATLRIHQRLIADFLATRPDLATPPPTDALGPPEPAAPAMPAVPAMPGTVAAPAAVDLPDWPEPDAPTDVWDTRGLGLGLGLGLGAGPGGPGAGDEPGAGREASTSDPGGLVAALTELPANERAVVVSRYYLGLSVTEIGEILGVDADEVTIVAARAFATLQYGQ
jgi:DNA-directed RNA polymerase specialized sigma24 family protein